MANFIQENGEATRPLNPLQKARNRAKSRIRVRVEHPCAFVCQSLGGLYQRCIGLARDAHQIGLSNLAYYLCRSVQLLRATA